MHRALAESRQETAAMRQALTATNIQGQWGELLLRRIVELAGMLSCDLSHKLLCLEETVTSDLISL